MTIEDLVSLVNWGSFNTTLGCEEATSGTDVTSIPLNRPYFDPLPPHVLSLRATKHEVSVGNRVETGGPFDKTVYQTLLKCVDHLM